MSSLDASPEAVAGRRDALEYTRALAAGWPDSAIIVVGRDERVWLAEGDLLDRHGYESATISGRPLHDLMPAFASATLVPRYRNALAGRPELFEYRTADGRGHYSVRLTPLHLGARQPRAVLAVVREGNDRPRTQAWLHEGADLTVGESDAMLHQGFDGSPIGMALTDAGTGRYLRVNDALCRLLGRTRESLLAMTFSEVTHGEDVPLSQRAHVEAAGDGAELEFEKRYVRSDGRTVWTSVHVVPVHAPDGAVKAFYTQIVDVTARKEQERLLRQEATDMEALAELRAALASDRLLLHAQPILDLGSDRIVQHELLVRLRRENGEIAGPAEFLPVAERHGDITDVDRWVTRHGIALAARGVPVEINLSAASVGDAETLATIRRALDRTGADPSLVVFEVTETALMADLERGRIFAHALRALGCRFALDDFGTGYGTFTYLKHLPVDIIKVDIEFVRDLTRSAEDERMVRAIVAMAREFGKLTVAEGVEDAATLHCLRRLGVDHVQGYHIGRPAPLAPDLDRWAREAA